MTSLLLFVLLALQTTWGGVDAGSAPANANCLLDGPRPTIAATTTSQASYFQYVTEKIVLNSNYGEHITMFCTSNHSSNLIILNSERQLLQTEEYNATTIQVLLHELEVGEHTYYCMDSNTSCNNSLIVTVKPAVTVSAPHVHHTVGMYGRPVFFVPRGENYSVFCSAQGVETLSIRIQSSDFEELETKTVNETTITATVTGSIEKREYACEKDSVTTYFKVIVDYSPEAQDFQCILHINYKLECAWRSSSKRNTFSLYILRPSGRTFLCSDMSGAIAAGCARAWNDELEDIYVYSEKFTLQMNACNEVFCMNQSFETVTKAMIKVDPVYNFKLLNTSSRSAEVAWRHKNYLCYRNCEYKVKYRLGTQWRQADASSLGCHDLPRDVSCHLKLALPCPNSHYELRVYVKPKAATRSQCWSEPASMSFFNSPGRFEEVGPACEADFREAGPTSSDAVLAEAQDLISDLNMSFNQKLAEIKALLDTQT